MSEDTIGQNGGVKISNTAVHTPATYTHFFAVSMITDCVFDTGTSMAAGSITGTLTGTTYPAGYVFYGRFTAVELVSGDCIAYEKAEVLT